MHNVWSVPPYSELPKLRKKSAPRINKKLDGRVQRAPLARRAVAVQAAEEHVRGEPAAVAQRGVPVVREQEPVGICENSVCGCCWSVKCDMGKLSMRFVFC